MNIIINMDSEYIDVEDYLEAEVAHCDRRVANSEDSAHKETPYTDPKASDERRKMDSDCNKSQCASSEGEGFALAYTPMISASCVRMGEQEPGHLRRGFWKFCEGCKPCAFLLSRLPLVRGEVCTAQCTTTDRIEARASERRISGRLGIVGDWTYDEEKERPGRSEVYPVARAQVSNSIQSKCAW